MDTVTQPVDTDRPVSTLSEHPELTPYNQFMELADISDAVKDFLEQELYQQDTVWADVGEIEANGVLQSCYILVLTELERFGISFTIPDEELLSNWVDARSILSIRKLVDTSTIYTLFSSSKEFRDQVSTLLSDDSVPDDVLIQEVIRLAKVYFSYDYIDKCYEYLDTYSSSYLLRDHLVACIYRFKDDYTGPLADNVVQYLGSVRQERRDFDTAITKIINTLKLYGQLDTNLINREIDNYNLDKISGTDVNLFALAEASTNQALKERVLYKHHARSIHHIEYYEATGTFITTEVVIMLVAAYYKSSDKGHQELIDGVEQLLTKYAEYFTTEQLGLITACRDALC